MSPSAFVRGRGAEEQEGRDEGRWKEGGRERAGRRKGQAGKGGGGQGWGWGRGVGVAEIQDFN